MENENEIVAQETQNTEVVETVQETEQTEVKPTPVETPEARVSRLKRELRRAQQKLGIEEEVEVKPTVKSFTLDRADKAFLNANGVKGADEYALVTDFVKNTGKDIEEIIDSKFFQTQIKELRETRESRAASDATSGSQRSNNSARDTVDYWVAKGQLPPPYMTNLRREVVNAKIKQATDTGKFTSSPVIGGR